MAEPDRRTQALQTAFGLFLRYGYRKTSMDDLARAVGVSRQALYLWFPNKQALFTATVDHQMDLTARGVQAALTSEVDVVERVVQAFDAYTGAFVGSDTNAVAMDELLEASARIVGDRVARFEGEFLERLAQQLAPYADDRLSAQDLAQVMYAVSAGSKHTVASREAYRSRLRSAMLLIVRGV